MKRILILLGLLMTLILCACDPRIPAPTVTPSIPETSSVPTEPVLLPSGPASTETTKPPCQHDWKLDETRPHTATCTAEGLEYYLCTLCGEKKSQTKDAVGHNWANIRLVSGDCTTGMTYHQRCRSCAAERDTTYQAGEHLPDWQNPGRTYAATCTEDGFRYAYCVVCGYRAKEVLPATGHSYGASGLCDLCGTQQPAAPDADSSTTPTN